MCSVAYHSSAFVFIFINKTLHEYEISAPLHILSLMSIFGLECGNNTRAIDEIISTAFCFCYENRNTFNKIQNYTFGINFVRSQVHAIKWLAQITKSTLFSFVYRILKCNASFAMKNE